MAKVGEGCIWLLSNLRGFLLGRADKELPLVDVVDQLSERLLRLEGRGHKALCNLE